MEPIRDIPDCSSLLITSDCSQSGADLDRIISDICDKRVVLLRQTESGQVDALMHDIATRLALAESLKLQSAFASVLGTRRNVGDYYMTVNERSDYNIVPPHSEGSTFANLQLASFYCVQNTTDGGETLLFRTSQDAGLWSKVREYRVKCQYSGTPTDAEKAKARTLYRLNLDKDVLADDDVIVNQAEVDARLRLYEVLAPPQQARSRLADEMRYVFWDSICALDHGVLEFTRQILSRSGLYKSPPNGSTLSDIDWDPHRRRVNFEVDYTELFNGKMILRLEPGDFLVFDNTYWAHSVNNWTPASGQRQVSAAFA